MRRGSEVPVHHAQRRKAREMKDAYGPEEAKKRARKVTGRCTYGSASWYFWKAVEKALSGETDA